MRGGRFPHDDNRGATKPVPSHQSRERSDPGSRRSLSSSRSERTTHHRAERSFARYPHDDNRGATSRSLHTNPARDRIPGPIIRTRHQDAGRRGEIPYNNNRGATRAGPFAPIPLKIGFRVPSFPPVIKIARELPTTEQNCQIYLGRIRARRLQPVHTLSHALGRE